MTDQELIRRIRLGEGGALELKEVHFSGNKIAGPKRAELADELAAFANSAGGVLVLGVNDETREVTGIPLELLDSVESLVREVCNDSIRPRLDAGIRRRELPAHPKLAGEEEVALRPVLSIEVPKSLFVHESSGGYFRRLGSSKRRMEALALQRLMMLRAQSGIISFDELPVPGTAPADLDSELAERFVSEEADFDLAVRKLGVIVEDEDGAERLSVAGVLLCTPQPEHRLRSAYIQAVFYAGDRLDKDYQLDAVDVVGPLDVQIAGALHFVRRNMRIGAVKPVARTDVPQYSERVVFEALVNAVAHRDYSMATSRIRLHLFSDRIELSVPGALANTLTPDSLHLRQASRNPLIVSLLKNCPSPSGVGKRRLMEQRGDGVPRIRADTKELTGRYPAYSLVDDSELRLVVPAAAAF